MFPITYQENETLEKNNLAGFEITIRGEFGDYNVAERKFYEFSHDDFSMPSTEEAYNEMQLKKVESIATQVVFISGSFLYLWDILPVLLLAYKRHILLEKIESIHIINYVEGEYFSDEVVQRLKQQKIDIKIIKM